MADAHLFRHLLVLHIRHLLRTGAAVLRINTILDSNKVLVMDNGKVGEYDSVTALMARPESAFRCMVVEAGLGGAFGV